MQDQDQIITENSLVHVMWTTDDTDLADFIEERNNL